jgi:hypothetical protein
MLLILTQSVLTSFDPRVCVIDKYTLTVTPPRTRSSARVARRTAGRPAFVDPCLHRLASSVNCAAIPMASVVLNACVVVV